MSTRFIVSAAVAVVATVATGGNFVAGAQAFSLTYGATGFLDPKQKVQGPRLDDLKAPQASYGTPIPEIIGTWRTGGLFVWASEKREVATTESQGKGGPGVESTTYTYEIDVFMKLSSRPAAGVLKIFDRGKLVWSQAADADSETLEASRATNLWRELRFYDGSDTQMPDPTYEAAVGVGNAPAYRGSAMLMIVGLNCGNSGQLPLLTFEVVSEGTITPAQAYSTVYEATVTDLFGSDAPSGLPSGMGNYVGPGHIIYSPNYGNSYANNGVTTIAHVEEEPFYSFGGMNWPLDTSLHPNAMEGISDEPYWLIVGQVGFAERYIADSFGTPLDTFTATPGEYNANWSIGGFARYQSRTLFFHAGVAPFDTLYKARGISYGSLVTDLPYQPISAAFSDDHWYVIGGTSDGTILRFDEGLAAAGTIPDPRPTSASGGGLMADTLTGELYFYYSGDLFKYDGASWDVYMTALPTTLAGLGVGGAFTGLTVTDGTLYGINVTYPGGNKTVTITKGVPEGRLTADPIYLSEVIERVCLRTKQLEAADLDVTDPYLTDTVVRGLAISQVGPARATLDNLMAAYLVGAVEGEKIKFVPRGGAPALTIPYEDLGVSPEGDAEPLPKRLLNDMETAARVSVKFSNVLNDYQDGTETGDRIVTESKAIEVVELPLALTPTEARRVAEANTMDRAVARLQIGPLAVSRKYNALEPTDVVLVEDRDGSTFRVRIERGTLGGGVNSFEVVLDDATAIDSEVDTDETYASSTLIRKVSATVAHLLDIPSLRDADADSPGLYVAAKPAVADSRWPGGELYKSEDGTTYAKQIDLVNRAVTGTAQTVLVDFAGGNVFDEVNTLTVDVGGGELSATTRDAMLTSRVNGLLVGSEIIQFRSASLLSPGVYLLSGFLRGRLGTEWAIPDHAAGERVVLLEASKLHHLREQQADLNVPASWKAVTRGKSLTTATARAFTNTGVNLKPYAPVDMALAPDGQGGNVLSWHRRSRLSSLPLATTAPPLGEATELYDVELYDDTDALVQSTTVSQEQWTIPNLEQTSNLIAPVASLQMADGKRLGIRQDSYTGTSQAYQQHSQEQMVVFSADGFTIEDQTIPLGTFNRVIVSGTTVYTSHSVTDQNGAVVSTNILRWDLSDIGGPVSGSFSGVGVWWSGIAFDGVNLWSCAYEANKIRKLDPDTCQLVDEYDMSERPHVLLYGGAGKMFVGTQEIQAGDVVKWDTGTQTEDWRVSVAPDGVNDLILHAGVLLALCSRKIVALDSTTGAVLWSAPILGSGYQQRAGVIHGSELVVREYGTSGPRLDFYEVATGARRSISGTWGFPVASIGGELYLTGSQGAGYSYQTKIFQEAAADLTGYSAKVYQVSASVGRGYPATIEF